jgi:hypothetical protein
MKNNGGYLINQIQKISSRKFNELLKEKILMSLTDLKE